MHTDRTTLSAPADLGAGWIHKADGNPITALCKQFKIQTKQTDYDNDILYWKDGKEVQEKDQNGADNLYEQIMKKVTSLGNTLKNDISLASAIDQIVAPMQLTNKQKLFQAYEEHVNIEHEWAGEMHTLSAKNYDEGDEFDGEDQLAVGGYDGIVHGLLSGLEIELKLRQVVSEIDYSSNNGVNVKIVDGSWVQGDFAICTVPLGVL